LDFFLNIAIVKLLFRLITNKLIKTKRYE